MKSADPLVPLQVEAKFEAEGPPQPLALIWGGARQQVTAVGRTWQESGNHHYLVMDEESRVYEIAYSIDGAAWRLIRSPDDFGPRRSRA